MSRKLPQPEDRRPAARPAAAQPERTKSTFREYVEAFGTAILLALFIRTFFVQAFKIPSGSMLPTLLIGDHLLVNKLQYGLRIPVVGKRVMQVFQPRRGDVVVFVYPEDRDKDYIKRIVGLPGETLEVRDKVLYVDGVAVEDPHAHFAPGARVLPGAVRDNFGPYVVPPGHVFVMGDNRDHSHDSRFWGPVPIDDILGKAFILYWSWDSENFRPRITRLGTLID